MMRLVVLGGGAMGRITARALAEDERVSEVLLADVSREAAERAVAALTAGPREGDGGDVRRARRGGDGGAAARRGGRPQRDGLPLQSACDARRAGREGPLRRSGRACST